MKGSIRIKESVNNGIWEESEHGIRNDMKGAYYGREVNKWVIGGAYRRGVIKETRHLLSFSL